jgi:hypothetical protein
MKRYKSYFEEGSEDVSYYIGATRIHKSHSASKVLQLMDKDVEYPKAIKQVSQEDGISIAQLEKEVEPFI